MGEGGGAGDTQGNAQNPGTLLGKLLRIDVESGEVPYGIPPTNPFLGMAGYRPEIWALGVRNPWRFSFDRGTGDLYIADVGQNQFEEIDFQAAPVTAGQNYGWDLKEGLHCHFESGDPPCPPSAPGLTDPVLEYCHSDGNDPSTCPAHPNGNSVTGGYVYRGCAMSGMQGVYFYGDYGSAFVNTFQGVSGGNAQNVTERRSDLSP